MEYLRTTYHARFLGSDPLLFPRRYEDPADREIVAFLAAGFAFGNVKAIGASLEAILIRMGGHPAVFARDHVASPPAWNGVAHRWIRARDAASTVCILGRILKRSGTIGAFFREGDDPAAPTVAPGLDAFSHRALALSPGGVTRGIRSFFPRPSDGSACKRLNLFLRWMARPDDGLDLGLWPFLKKSRLVIPLDTHMARICRRARLTRYRSPGWRMAESITASLRRLDPEDPVKYDFAITRLGILPACIHGDDPEKCGRCGLRNGGRRRKSESRNPKLETVPKSESSKSETG